MRVREKKNNNRINFIIEKKEKINRAEVRRGKKKTQENLVDKLK